MIFHKASRARDPPWILEHGKLLVVTAVFRPETGALRHVGLLDLGSVERDGLISEDSWLVRLHMSCFHVVGR